MNNFEVRFHLVSSRTNIIAMVILIFAIGGRQPCVFANQAPVNQAAMHHVEMATKASLSYKS